MLPCALLFPNAYGLGMSNLGFQLLYRELNDMPAVLAERVFLPEAAAPPLSLESHRPLADFPLIFCSVSFEQDFANLVSLLHRGGIPPLAADRDRLGDRPGALASGRRPLVVAGGVATFINPEVLAPFVDLFLVGEAEPILSGLLDFLDKHLETSSTVELLREVALRFPGCYAPRFYHPEYTPDGTIGRVAVEPGLPCPVKRLVLSDPAGVVGHSQLFSPDAEFSDMFLAELGRGCSRGCRFCAAGFVYRPPRLWSAERVTGALAGKPADIKRVGLLGMEMARPGDLAVIAEHIEAAGCGLSFSSLRADALTPALLELLGRGGLKTATIAPDGGSERLRRVINKGISRADILGAAEAMAEAGLGNLKLYFMIGLPTETDEDISEMLELVLEIKEIVLAAGRRKGRLGDIFLSINSFVPKPWTPFMFHPFAGVEVLQQRIKLLRRGLSGVANLHLKVDRPDSALQQAVLARGDRRLAPLLLSLAVENSSWKKACKTHRIDPAWYAERQRSKDEIFPWDIIDHSITRRYLWEEYQRGLAARATPPCDTLRCKRCGVCTDAP